MGNPLLFGETDFTVGFADPMFLFDLQLFWSYDYSKWAIFFTKNRIYNGKFKFREAVMGVENFCTKLPKRYTLTPNLVEHRLAYVSVKLF